MTAVALAPHQIPAAVRGRGRPKAAAPDLVRRGSAEMASGSRRRGGGGQREKPCSSGRDGSEDSKATLTRKHSATTDAGIGERPICTFDFASRFVQVHISSFSTLRIDDHHVSYIGS
jgi:hypothetical protein